MNRLNRKILEIVRSTKNCEKIFAFFPMPEEPNITQVIKRLLNNYQLFTPVFMEGKWKIGRLNKLYELCYVKYNISQPKDCKTFENLEEAGFSQNDCCLIPGILFSEKGERLGHGGGIYDRYLENLECLKIGICLERQIVTRLPQEKRDVKMNIILAPRRTFISKHIL